MSNWEEVLQQTQDMMESSALSVGLGMLQCPSFKRLDEVADTSRKVYCSTLFFTRNTCINTPVVLMEVTRLIHYAHLREFYSDHKTYV